jgi:hypothetical protein
MPIAIFRIKLSEEQKLMKLKPEITRILQREMSVSEIAINRLKEKLRPLEEEYGWSTDLFVEKFNQGEAGDDQVFFRWYAMAEALKDWQNTIHSLEEVLAGSGLVSA